MSNEEKLALLECKMYAVEVAMDQLSDKLEKQTRTETEKSLVRHTELKTLIEQNSMKSIVKDNIKWLFLALLAVSSGASGVAKIIELLPQLVK